IVRPYPSYASKQHDCQQRNGPGDELDLAGLNEARLEVSPPVGRSVPPSEYERREDRRNDDREHNNERVDQERRRPFGDNSFGTEDDQLLAARQRQRREHGSAAEADGGRRSTFELGAQSQRLAREGFGRIPSGDRQGGRSRGASSGEMRLRCSHIGVPHWLAEGLSRPSTTTLARAIVRGGPLWPTRLARIAPATTQAALTGAEIPALSSSGTLAKKIVAFQFTFHSVSPARGGQYDFRVARRRTDQVGSARSV